MGDLRRAEADHRAGRRRTPPPCSLGLALRPVAPMPDRSGAARRPVRRPGAGDQRQPRARLRRARPRARAARRRRRARSPTTACASTSRARARDAGRATRRTWSCARCGPRSTALGGQPPGLRLRCANRIPHGRGLGSSAAAIVGRRAAGPRAGRRRRRRCRTRRPARAGGRARGPSGQRRACLLGGLTVAWTGATARPRGAPAPASRGSARWCSSRRSTASTEQARGAAAGRRAARRRRVHRRPGGAARGRADRRRRRRCSPRPRTACTSRTGRRRCRPDRRARRGAARARAAPRSISGAGPTVLVLARDEAEVEQAIAARAAAAGGAQRWPSTSPGRTGRRRAR